jgi:hypothetical protein
MVRRIVLAAVLLASACAHTQATRETASTTAVKERVFVTGSHIPQEVDPVTGLPRAPTASPLRIYGRDRLGETGEPNVNAALRDLDPSL